VNGGYVALAQAIKHLMKSGALAENPLRAPVGAVSVGLVGGKPTVDMCYREDKDAEADVNLVMTAAGDFVEVQGTAEGEPFSPAQLDRLLNAGRAAIRKIIQAQRRTLGSRA
jgi:ribonuclease PH